MSILHSTIAWLSATLNESDLSPSWREATQPLGQMARALTEADFHRARSVLTGQKLSEFLGNCPNLEDKRTGVGILLLAHILNEKLAGLGQQSYLKLNHFNAIAAVAAQLEHDTQLPLTVMPPPTQQNSRPKLPKAPSNFTTRQPNIGRLVFSSSKEMTANHVHSMIPEAHLVRGDHNEFIDGLESLPLHHWLTIVIPAMDPSKARQAIQGIAEQTGGGVTVLVISPCEEPPAGNLEALSSQFEGKSDLAVLHIRGFDRGPYDAMNLGIKIAKTPWIYFLGVDDSLASSNVLSEVKIAADRAPQDSQIIYGNVEIQGSGHGTYDKQIYAYEFDYDRMKRQTPCHQAIFYRTAALRRIGGYSLQYPVCADWHANLQLWRSAEPIFIDLVIAKFARGGISSSIRDDQFFDDLPGLWALYSK